jgi:hypothetical protein
MNAAWALAVLPVAALSTTLVNLATWRRGDPRGRFEGAVSVLVPARNEAPRIGACLDSIARSSARIDEILVYDDESTDGTPDVVRDRASADPRIRLVPTRPLPEGWVGKAHACEQLSRAARGDVVVFVDADVRLEPEGLARLASCFTAPDASVVTAVPGQEMRTFVERLLMPLLLLTYVSWLPLELVARTRDPRVVAANGQILGLRREALSTLGHFRCVASEVVDDVALCRAAKVAGLRVAFVDGTRMATCRMYESGGALWEGFSKNVAEGLGGAAGVALAIAVYLLAFLAPWGLLAAAQLELVAPAWTTPALVAASANLAQRVVVALRYRQAWLGVLLHPFAIVAWVALALRSLSWTLRGRVRWSGRVYRERAARKVVA